MSTPITNLEFAERINDQRTLGHINQLIWIASVSADNYKFREFLEELDRVHFEAYLPEIFQSEFFENYIGNGASGIIEALHDFNKFGFLAEIYLPYCTGFLFDEEGNPKSWAVHSGWCSIVYAYAETLEELVAHMEQLSEKHFQNCLEKAKREKKQLSQNPKPTKSSANVKKN